jgi:hypothetical protein
MDLYDIVRLTETDNEDLDGKSAFITRVRASASDTYDLFFPGDEHTPPAFLTYSDLVPEKGSVKGVIVQESLKNPYKTLAETLNLSQGSLLVGIRRDDPTKKDPLQVVRFTDTALVVTRTNDPTEIVIEIPLENGIGVGSEYGFLQPAMIDDEDDTEVELSPEKQAFLDRIQTSPDIKVIYTKTPVLREKIEIPVVGGTQDVSRLTNQLISAIRAIDSKDTTDNTRIQSLIQETTLHNGSSRVIIDQDTPIMLRSHMKFPPWIIPVDGSRTSGIVTDQNTSERIQDEATTDRKKPYHLFNKITGSGLHITPARGSHLQPIPERMEVIVSKEPAVSVQKEFTPTYTSDFYRKRVLLPIVPNACSRTPMSSSFRDPDQYTPVSAIVLPPHSYAPPTANLLERLRDRPWIAPLTLDPEGIVESSVPLTNTIIDGQYLLSEGEIASYTHMLASVSPSIEAILSLPMKHGSLDEIGSKGSVYGYNVHNILTHEERVIASAYLRITSERLLAQLRDKDVRVPIYSVTPRGLYKDLKDLHTLYPNTLGMIGNEEALDRVIQTEGDYGLVLLGMLGADEYTSMDTTIREIIRNSEGKRTRIREEMAEVQGRLRELETTLRTLPKIAKHYGSRKEVEKAKGTIPLWDEHLDDDPDKDLYYSDRFRKIVGRILNEMQMSGELDEVLRSEHEESAAASASAAAAASSSSSTGRWNTEDIIRKIPVERLNDAVREDLNRYNLSVGESARITGDRFETIVQRIIMGGRPVQDGDIALITRHLRTAAYKWSTENAKWTPLREDEGIFAGDDTNPNPNSTKIFTQTLHLNKEYRQLSKMNDDLEMIARRPEMMTDPEKLTNSLNTLVEKVSSRANDRIAYLQRNRVVDEIPFLYDRTKYITQRYAYENEQIPEDGQSDSRISRSEYKRARLEAILETDTDLDLYEAGYGQMGDDLGKQKKGTRFASVGEIANTDPVLSITNERNGPSTFISGVKGRDRIVRVYLASIGFLETLLNTPLTQSEIILCTKEAGSILNVKATNRDAIQRGIAMYCAIICTRMNNRVLIPKSEGETPPPVQTSLPSYRVPFRESEPDGLLPFIVKVLSKSAKRSVEGRSTTTFSVILKNIGKVGLVSSRDDTQGSRAIANLRDIISRISKTSPGLIPRVLDTRTIRVRENETERALRISNQWETIPIIHNPHPESAIVQASRDVLSDVELILKDPQGVPYPANSGLELPIQTPELLRVLESIHNTRSERLQELLYSLAMSDHDRIHSLVLTAPAPEYIGVLRDRIVTIPLLEEEAPQTKYITAEPIGTLREPSLKARSKELLEGLIREVLQEGQVGIIARGSTVPIRALERELRSSKDTHGALRGGMIAFHDALILACEQYARSLQSESEPVSCEQVLYPSEYKQYPKQTRSIPIYTSHEIVKGLLKGVSPLMIQYSRGSIGDKGGSRNTVLTGTNTYFERITEMTSILEEMRLRTLENLRVFERIVVRLRNALSELPDVITREELFSVLHEGLNEDSDQEDVLLGIEYYVTFLAHRSDIFERTRSMSLVHTDVDDMILDEELNRDREQERQRFIYQLEALDPERRELARASRALGVDLAGAVARDPRKFNAEYYEIVNSLVATQEMQDQAPGSSREYGDQQDVMFERDAIDGAFEGVDQIEGLDYDE